MRRIEDAMDVKRTCVAQNRRKMSLGKDTMKFVDEHLDWDEEALCRQYLKQMRGTYAVVVRS